MLHPVGSWDTASHHFKVADECMSRKWFMESALRGRAVVAALRYHTDPRNQMMRRRQAGLEFRHERTVLTAKQCVPVETELPARTCCLLPAASACAAALGNQLCAAYREIWEVDIVHGSRPRKILWISMKSKRMVE